MDVRILDHMMMQMYLLMSVARHPKQYGTCGKISLKAAIGSTQISRRAKTMNSAILYYLMSYLTPATIGQIFGGDI